MGCWLVLSAVGSKCPSVLRESAREVQIIVSLGLWDFSTLTLTLPSCIVSRILSIPPLYNSSEDLLISKFVNHNGFVLISAYAAFFPNLWLRWICLGSGRVILNPKSNSLCGCYGTTAYLTYTFLQLEKWFKILPVLGVIARSSTNPILFVNVLKVERFGGACGS